MNEVPADEAIAREAPSGAEPGWEASGRDLIPTTLEGWQERSDVYPSSLDYLDDGLPGPCGIEDHVHGCPCAAGGDVMLRKDYPDGER